MNRPPNIDITGLNFDRLHTASRNSQYFEVHAACGLDSAKDAHAFLKSKE